MAGSLNRVQLIGNVGRDPEIRSTQAGTRLANLSLATTESWRDRSSGERREKTEWHRIVIWQEQLVEVVDKYVRKGDKLMIEGKLETRKWTDNGGVERYTTEIVLQGYGGQLIMLGSSGGRDGARSNGGGGGGGHGRLADREPGNAYEPTPRQRGRNDDLDDEIPF